MILFSEYYKRRYGFRVFKIGLSTGIECPRREMSEACVFCVKDTFMDNELLLQGSVTGQINFLIQKLKSRVKAGGYIAYFQDNTSLYGDIEYLYRLFEEASNHLEILEVIISTRPDCLSRDILDKLCELKKPVTIEIGVQTVNDKSLSFLNRGHLQSDNQNALDMLSEYKFRVGIHIILGIVGETYKDIDKTLLWINEHTIISDVKIHHLAVFKGSRLSEIIKEDEIISLDEYLELLSYFLNNLREDVVISRMFTSNLNRHKTMLNDFPGVKRDWMNRFRIL